MKCKEIIEILETLAPEVPVPVTGTIRDFLLGVWIRM